jgi:hypothetical protein
VLVCCFVQWTRLNLTIAAILHTSVLAPHLLPRMTSGDLYCLVWMSFVKWCPTQQAFPRSAILTEMVSNAASAACSRSVFDEALLFLSRLMPDTSFVRRSLVHVSVCQTIHLITTYAVFSRCFCTSSSPAEGLRPSRSAMERLDAEDEVARAPLITIPSGETE